MTATAKQRMKALLAPELVLAEIEQPAPGPGDLCIRVAAAGVIQTELDWYSTFHQKDGAPRKQTVLGHEFSGLVNGTGEEVFGMNSWFADGAMAEYCLAQPGCVAPKPQTMTHAEAASVPISALTAWQALFDRAKLKSGERVLVHGGAGAVGGYAVQMARNCGAHVVASASTKNLEFVLELGAEKVVDYRAERFEDCVMGVDVVFDTVGGDTWKRSRGVVKTGGRLVTVVSTEENDPDFLLVEPNGKQLAEIGQKIDTGKLRPVVDLVVPLAEAPHIYQGNIKRQGRGKIVVTVP